MFTGIKGMKARTHYIWKITPIGEAPIETIEGLDGEADIQCWERAIARAKSLGLKANEVMVIAEGPGENSHETAQSRASIGGLLAEYVEKSERVQKLKEALRSIADACECTCGECPCQRIAESALI
jgi:hypothetical protein